MCSVRSLKLRKGEVIRSSLDIAGQNIMYLNVELLMVAQRWLYKDDLDPNYKKLWLINQSSEITKKYYNGPLFV